MKDVTRHHRHAWQRGQRRAELIERLKIAAALAVVIGCYGIAGALDYEDAVAMEAAAKAPVAIKLTVK